MLKRARCLWMCPRQYESTNPSSFLRRSVDSNRWKVTGCKILPVIPAEIVCERDDPAARLPVDPAGRDVELVVLSDDRPKAETHPKNPPESPEVESAGAAPG